MVISNATTPRSFFERVLENIPLMWLLTKVTKWPCSLEFKGNENDCILISQSIIPPEKMHFFSFSTLKNLRDQIWTCRQRGQEKTRITIYINLFHNCYVSRQSALWFWRKKRFFKVFTIYGYGGHLSHVTWTKYINFLCFFVQRLHLKLWIEFRPVDSEEKFFENLDGRQTISDLWPN